ncbi:MAG: T9SS type A sorting domain-containing protein [Porphyromonadaceae bacterium]|nr:T9SS type A sorting domain-containing protein [Porphyromonadaceae bacterium]
MKKISLLWCIIAIMYGTNLSGASYYVATNGSDSNNGSLNAPFKTLQKAVSLVNPGDYIYLRGGTHIMTVSSIVIDRSKNGTSSSMIRVHAYGSEKPILRYNNVENASNRGIVQDASYWHWKGITIERAGDNGMLVSGNNNIIENCIFRNNYDSGLQISRYSTSYKTISEWPSNNLIVGCESYDNRDSGNENADGFAAKLTCGTGNIFRDCIAHHNIDDGWDLYTKSDTGPIGVVVFENCIAHNNGKLTDGSTSGNGDKNGFKLGSSSHKVNHILRRCIAFGNGKHGFTDNGNIGSIEFTNLTAYNNGDYNIHTRDNATHVFKNCISFNGNRTDRIVGNASAPNALTGSAYNWPYSASSSDFVTMTQGPNSAPTSNGFLNLKSSSNLIDKGVKTTGITYNGTNPDLGAVEYGGTTTTTYTLTTNVQGSGSVTPSTSSYTSGSVVSVNATPASGWEFSNWTGAASGSTNPINITMNGNKTLTAVFVQSQSGGGGDPGTGTAQIHNFTQSGLNSSFFTITGNLSTSKGTVNYNGLTLTQCLKIESATSIQFTLSQPATLTLVFNPVFNGRIKIDGNNVNATAGIAVINLGAGSHTITKGDTANLYYMSLSGGSSSNTAIINGTYSIVAVHSGKAVDLFNWETGDGSNIVQWDYWGGEAQQFNITNVDGEWHRITPVIATSKALDVDGFSTANGANIHIWNYWGGQGQQFKFQNAGTGRYRLIARHSGKCMDVYGASTGNGANVIQWECISGATNQMFQLIKVINPARINKSTDFEISSADSENAVAKKSEKLAISGSFAKGNLRISLPNDFLHTDVTVEIRDIKGMIVYSQIYRGTEIIETSSNLTNGIYIVTVRNYSKSMNEKIIVR